MQHPELVVVKTFGSRPEADFAEGALASVGIDAMSQADTAGLCGNMVRDRFSFLVREDDVRAALKVLTPANEPSSDDDDGESAIL